MAAKTKAAAKTASKAKQLSEVRENPYVRAIVEDESLRNDLWATYTSARTALDRLNNGKSPQQALFEDKKLQKELQNAANSLRDAGSTLREAPKKRSSGGGLSVFRLLLIAVVGAIVALAVSEGLRKKVLDALFGAEEEFEYTSTTSVPPAAPAAPSGSPTETAS